MATIEADRVRSTDRRRWPRAGVSLPVRLIETEGRFNMLSGHTVELGVGGLRARLDGPLSGEVEATVCLDLEPGRTLVCEALVAGGGVCDGAWEYRLAFRNLEPDDVAALQRLVEQAA